MGLVWYQNGLPADQGGGIKDAFDWKAIYEHDFTQDPSQNFFSQGDGTYIFAGGRWILRNADPTSAQRAELLNGTGLVVAGDRSWGNALRDWSGGGGWDQVHFLFDFLSALQTDFNAPRGACRITAKMKYSGLEVAQYEGSYIALHFRAENAISYNNTYDVFGSHYGYWHNVTAPHFSWTYGFGTPQSASGWHYGAGFTDFAAAPDKTYWVRFTMQGAVIFYEVSADGTTWRPMGYRVQLNQYMPSVTENTGFRPLLCIAYVRYGSADAPATYWTALQYLKIEDGFGMPWLVP